MKRFVFMCGSMCIRLSRARDLTQIISYDTEATPLTRQLHKSKRQLFGSFSNEVIKTQKDNSQEFIVFVFFNFIQKISQKSVFLTYATVSNVAQI